MSEGRELITQRVDKPNVKSNVKIINTGHKLGSGLEGTISRVEVASTRAPSNPIGLAYKEFRGERSSHYDLITNNYEMTKDAGLPVPQTFRTIEGKNAVFITDLTEGGKNVVLSINNARPDEVEQLYKDQPEIMNNFANATELHSDSVNLQFDKYAELATNADLHLASDTWFIVIKPDGSYEFVIGDFMNIKQLKNQGKDELHNINDISLHHFQDMAAAIQEYGVDPQAAKEILRHY